MNRKKHRIEKSGQYYVTLSDEQSILPWVLFLHGGVSPGQSLWGRAAFLVRRLSRNYQVLIPDWGGFGKSRTMPVVENIDAIAAGLIEALDRENIASVHLIGYSWGGTLALHMAANYPAYIDRLVLICPTAEQVSLKYRLIHLGLLVGLRLRPVTTWAMGLGVLMERNQRARHGLRRFQREFAAASLAHVTGVVTAFTGFDSRPWLGTIKNQTLLIFGERDMHCDAAQQAILTKGIANLHPAAIGKGHIPLDTNIREVTNATLQFLGGNEHAR